MIDPADSPDERSLARQPSAGPPGGFPVVTVRQDIGKPAGTPGPIVATVAEALQRVRAGGKIEVHPGVYHVPHLTIDRPVTIEGASSERPVFDAMGEDRSLSLEDMDAGPVVIRGIEFRNTYGALADPDEYWFASIVIDGRYDTVLIEDSEFHPADPPDATADGSDFFDGNAIHSSANGNGVTVRDNDFVGGDIGLSGSEFGAQWIAVGNRFTGQANASVHTGGTGRIEGNSFGDCGRVCITAGSSRAVFEIVDNQISIDMARPVEMGIWPTGGRRVVITGNRIVGAGGAADPDDPGTWPIRFAISLYQVAEAVVSDNEIRHAHSGIWLDRSTASGTDNSIHDVAIGIGGWGPPVSNVAVLNRNDISSYTFAFDGYYSFASADLTCNWWGSAAGPAGVHPTVDADVYTPWATAPVAGTSAEGCDGGS